MNTTFEDFWNIQENSQFFNPIKQSNDLFWKNIVENWGVTSVQLKNYLKEYYHEDNKYCYKDNKININYILPLCNNFRFYGKMANYRLYYAMMAKAVLMIKYDTSRTDLELEAKYRFEVLKLFLRIDSTKTLNLNFKQFSDNTVNIWNAANTDLEGTYNKVAEKSLKYKEEHKNSYKKTKYHYVVEDFTCILPNMKLDTAYNIWLKVKFPNILNDYVNRLVKEKVCSSNSLWTTGKNTISFEMRESIKDSVKDLKIEKPNKNQFRMILKRLDIQYNIL